MSNVLEALNTVLDQEGWSIEGESMTVRDSDGARVSLYDIADHLADHGCEETLVLLTRIGREYSL